MCDATKAASIIHIFDVWDLVIFLVDILDIAALLNAKHLLSCFRALVPYRKIQKYNVYIYLKTIIT